MLDKGLKVMVNSDDPAYFGGYLNKNLIETSKAFTRNLLKNIKSLVAQNTKHLILLLGF